MVSRFVQVAGGRSGEKQSWRSGDVHVAEDIGA